MDARTAVYENGYGREQPPQQQPEWATHAPDKPQRVTDVDDIPARPSDMYEDNYVPSSVKNRIDTFESPAGSRPSSTSAYDDLITASVDVRRGVVTSPSEDEVQRINEEKRQAYLDFADQLDALDGQMEPMQAVHQQLGTV